MYRYLQSRRDGAVEYLTLNRPDVRNAFNEVMIGELSAWAGAMHADPSVLVFVEDVGLLGGVFRITDGLTATFGEQRYVPHVGCCAPCLYLRSRVFRQPRAIGLIGEFDVDLVHEFFQGFVNHAQVTLHVDNLRGANAHHQAETVFKAFARALRMALTLDPRSTGSIPSTKGSL